MADEIIYDEILMNDIISEYKSCKTELDRMIRLLNDFENNIKANYVGKANNGIDTLFTSLNEHLESYSICMQTTSSFVESALESAKLLDQRLINPSVTRSNDIKIGVV